MAMGICWKSVEKGMGTIFVRDGDEGNGRMLKVDGEENMNDLD